MAERRQRQQWQWRTAAASPELPDLDALLDDLDMPEIDADLASLQTEQGAVFDVSACAAGLPQLAACWAELTAGQSGRVSHILLAVKWRAALRPGTFDPCWSLRPCVG